MRFLSFFQERGRRNPKPGQRKPILAPQYTVSARVFLGNAKSGTRLTVCAFLRRRGNGEEVWLALAAITLA